jgi:hypothetical protein
MGQGPAYRALFRDGEMAYREHDQISTCGRFYQFVGLQRGLRIDLLFCLYLTVLDGKIFGMYGMEHVGMDQRAQNPFLLAHLLPWEKDNATLSA